MDANKVGLIMIIASDLILEMESQMTIGMDIILDGTKDTASN